jgi:predicted secreted Zn-dependent protease
MSDARLRTIVFASAALLLAVGCGAPLPPSTIGPVPMGMTVDAQETEYVITGATAAELRAAMREAGPNVRGRRWDAATRWNVRWRYRYSAPYASSCRMDSVTVAFESRITLPRWDAPPDTPATLAAQWQTFLDALRVHEYGHRNIGADAAREVRRELRALRTLDCSQMNSLASATARRILARFRERDLAYDVETRHGQLQGVVWPPHETEFRFRP